MAGSGRHGPWNHAGDRRSLITKPALPPRWFHCGPGQLSKLELFKLGMERETLHDSNWSFLILNDEYAVAPLIDQARLSPPPLLGEETFDEGYNVQGLLT